ncbi:protein FAM200C-like [Palaemon carinicauda]|uniref:protein FAM200C-like n=1 Tax=Palaemon carinicauda TaxID=392227 RepID=UPI0035B591D4
MKASYEVALLVAINMKPHTIAESLIMPAAKILVSHVIGEEVVAKLESVSVSKNTVQRCIEMSVDIADQVVEGVKSSKYGFSTQLDESTDVTNCSQLLVYVRFMQNNAAKTELLLSQDLSSKQQERIFSTFWTISSSRMNWTGESWSDARQMGLHRCSVESQVFKPM